MSPALDASHTVRAYNFSVTAPGGWDVRIGGASPFPIMHGANFALPAARGDFGGLVVPGMTIGQVFVALLDYGTVVRTDGLFAPSGHPKALDPDWFNPRQMQRPIAGMAGVQRFFNTEGRKYCLYSVIGSYARRALLVPLVNQFLAGITIHPAVP